MGVLNGEAVVVGCLLAETGVVGRGSRGGGRGAWAECVRHDLRSLRVRAEWARDRNGWRIGGASLGGTVQPMQAWKNER